MDDTHRGLLIVLSSPSGGGKTSVYWKILERHPNYLYSISATTRHPRKNERDGEDYYFLSEDEFIRKIDMGEFVEWAFVYGHRYGTPRAPIEDALAKNAVMLFDLDVQGADSMKRAFPHNVINIFILPPSHAELERRLTLRRTNQPDDIEQRLKNAAEEVKRAFEYDYLVINDDLEVCVSQVESTIVAELCRPRLQLPIEGWNI